MQRKGKRTVKGRVRVGRKTKQLIPKLAPRSIVVLSHENLDEVAADGLIAAKVKAVINAARTMNGTYPLEGPKRLLLSGIPIVEIAAEDFTKFRDGMAVMITDEHVMLEDGRKIPCKPFTEEAWEAGTKLAMQNVSRQLGAFIENTLRYADREKEFFIRPLQLPPIRTPISGRHAVVVVRGKGYRDDLYAIRDYIEDYKPVLIGVDGGADALLDCGLRPDLIFGDMDSITDRALRSGAELIVHAFPDGTAPGMARIQELELEASVIRAPGTSEDIAMLLAYEQQAELIVTLGTHTHMIDFLEKGRKGMASTMLVRMKIGGKLIDAKGVSKLYSRPYKLRRLWYIPAAALFPVLMLSFVHPGVRHMIDVIWLYVKLSLGSI
ncbi:thiamin pyrophosphokinase [Insulibacter thermoxylanivorax]|uniref:Thiamin pyrophosphokinase n=1 Tax=Insulibacter thermoxylanivorax TaxID=2749268 RepID=A0A916VEY7_9BACL|nr:putative cytokinetic ring protein SteA [Insulibacter thermoxylanivorax]GFR36801.1 thiamin pyrophosphokinase [Insulibacter thermoxylanivorax]